MGVPAAAWWRHRRNVNRPATGAATGYNPITAESWQSLLWMSSPNQTPPADGAAVTAWAQDGAQGDGWVNNSGTVNYDEVDPAFGDQPALDQASGGSLVDAVTSIDAACTVVIVGEVQDNELNFVGANSGPNGPMVGAFSGAYLCASQGFGGTASGGTATTGPHLLVAEFTGSAVTLEVDGAVVIDNQALTTGVISTEIAVGAAGFSGYTLAQAFVGVVNGTLADKAALEAWVADTYGITIS